MEQNGAIRLSAGVIVVCQHGTWPRYLLLRAYRYWDFPKGEVDPGEAPLTAAIREVEEETTLTELDFRWGCQYRETESYQKNKVARYYLAASPTGKVALPVSAELGRPEHHEYRWLDYERARSRLVDRLKSILDWANDIVC